MTRITLLSKKNYAVNSIGYVQLGGDIRNIYILLLLSLSFGTVTDIDGNVYETVQIGGQLWMAENLKVTHYNNGDEITHINNNEDWGSFDEGQYGVYGNDPSNADIYGNLYNFAVIEDERGVCPDEFHVPSDEEIMELEMYLGMSEEEANSYEYRGTNEGSKLAGNSDLWNDGDLENNSEFGTSGFTLLPAGNRLYSGGSYHSIGLSGLFWTSSGGGDGALFRVLVEGGSGVFRRAHTKQLGLSIRCLQDEITTGCTDPEACNYDETATADDGSCLYYDLDGSNCETPPAAFSFNQSNDMAFYYFLSVTINGVALEPEDWVGAFNGDICVGARQWDTSLCNNGVCDLQVMGDYGNGITDGYMTTGEIPFFKIYDTSENAYYDAVASEDYPWYNFGMNSIVSLTAEEDIDGCMDEMACNYNADATEDDSSCFYAEENYNCEGDCIESDCAGACGGDAEFDECGICGGDNSTCTDCNGVINGTAEYDNCGTCDNDPSNDCVQDCAGSWGGSLVDDECGICDGDNSTCTDCAGVPNGDNVVDNCGTCNNDPSNNCVQDCTGEWGGSIVNDECGICGGDNSTCTDCNDVVNGTAEYDNCGTCDNYPSNDCVQDCGGTWGGSLVNDACGVCEGNNSTCDIQSTQMAAYYFSFVTLDSQAPNDDVEIVARNEESGMVVGSGLYGNVGNSITEVLVFGEMAEDYIVNTDGLMLNGQIPQFYVDGHKAHYVAADGDTLQYIPAFYPFQFYIDLTLHLETDCTGDMGGSAVTTGICGDCWGGNTGYAQDYNDPDADGICNAGSANGDADNCPNIPNGPNEEDNQENYDGDEEGDTCDADDDNDDVADGDDSHPFDNTQCLDDDGDTCDSCSSGIYDPYNDGADNDGDGWCNDGDDWPDCSNEIIDENPNDECGNCHGDGFEDECIDNNDCNDMDCAGLCGQANQQDDCNVCDDNYNNDCYGLEIILDGNVNLISFPALPGNGDYSVGNIFSQLCDNLIGVMWESKAFVNLGDCNLIGSLTEVEQDEGYWVILNTVPDTLIMYDAVPVSYNGDGQVEYEMHYGNNLISYPFQTTQSLDDALGNASSFVFGLFGEGMAALNINDGWVGSLEAFEGGKGYWLVTSEDFTFTFNEPEGGLARIAHQPALRPVPEVHRFMQSSKQAFYFIESATIYGKVLDDEDIIIAYNGDVVVGARYWNGEYTDVSAMGMDEYSNSEGYCKSGDRVSFKVWDASSNELIDMETDIETAWNDLSLSLINITEILPDDFSLDRAYPNPFNPTTTLNFALPLETELTITIYNLQGREVISLVDGNMEAGYHSVVWNADRHSSGVYFVKMIAGEYIHTQKIMLVK